VAWSCGHCRSWHRRFRLLTTRAEEEGEGWRCGEGRMGMAAAAGRSVCGGVGGGGVLVARQLGQPGSRTTAILGVRAPRPRGVHRVRCAGLALRARKRSGGGGWERLGAPRGQGAALGLARGHRFWLLARLGRGLLGRPTGCAGWAKALAGQAGPRPRVSGRAEGEEPGQARLLRQAGPRERGWWAWRYKRKRIFPFIVSRNLNEFLREVTWNIKRS